jgi:hypothetical protein
LSAPFIPDVVVMSSFLVGKVLSGRHQSQPTWLLSCFFCQHVPTCYGLMRITLLGMLRNYYYGNSLDLDLGHADIITTRDGPRRRLLILSFRCLCCYHCPAAGHYTNSAAAAASAQVVAAAAHCGVVVCGCGRAAVPAIAVLLVALVPQQYPCAGSCYHSSAAGSYTMLPPLP